MLFSIPCAGPDELLTVKSAKFKACGGVKYMWGSWAEGGYGERVTLNGARRGRLKGHWVL